MTWRTGWHSGGDGESGEERIGGSPTQQRNEMPPLFFQDCKTVRAAWWRGAEVKRLRDSTQIKILLISSLNSA